MAETLTMTREYPYPADRLFRAWTDIGLLTQWFGCAENMLWTVHEWDVRPGGAIRVSLMFDRGPFEVTGEFEVVEPPHRLRYRWQDDQTVDVTIEDIPAGSRLTLMHSGLSDFEMPIVTGGWTFGLEELAKAGGPAEVPGASM
jgi:uncharacterized protein YndB with AHSA1/START domain